MWTIWLMAQRIRRQPWDLVLNTVNPPCPPSIGLIPLCPLLSPSRLLPLPPSPIPKSNKFTLIFSSQKRFGQIGYRRCRFSRKIGAKFGAVENESTAGSVVKTATKFCGSELFFQIGATAAIAKSGSGDDLRSIARPQFYAQSGFDVPSAG